MKNNNSLYKDFLTIVDKGKFNIQVFKIILFVVIILKGNRKN
jgi:hypothetical protein